MRSSRLFPRNKSPERTDMQAGDSALFDKSVGRSGATQRRRRKLMRRRSWGSFGAKRPKRLVFACAYVLIRRM